MRANRGVDPSPVNMCPECGHECLPTPLGIAEHKAKHLDRARQRIPLGPGAYPASCLLAWRDYAHELENHASDLRGQVHHLETERRRLLKDIATRDERIEDLEAEVNREEADT